jgi:hypothetical protein
LSLAFSMSKEPRSGTNGPFACISVYLNIINPMHINRLQKSCFHLFKILRQSAGRLPSSSFTKLVPGPDLKFWLVTAGKIQRFTHLDGRWSLGSVTRRTWGDTAWPASSLLRCKTLWRNNASGWDKTLLEFVPRTVQHQQWNFLLLLLLRGRESCTSRWWQVMAPCLVL